MAEMILLEHKITSSQFTNWDDRFVRLERRVDELSAQQSKILDSIRNLTGKATYAAVTAGDQRGPKIPAPNKFRGDDPKTDVGDWAAGARAYLRGFVCAEQTKVATILGLLEGPALKWATSTSSSLQQSMENWAFGLGVDKLLQALEDRFADKERALKVADRIARLGQQGYSGTLQALFAELEQLTSTPGLVMSSDDLLTNFCRAAPEKFVVALYNAGHKDWRSFGRAVLEMEAKLHVQAPSSDKRKGAFPRGGRRGKAAFTHAGPASGSDSDSQPDAPSDAPPVSCPPEIQQVVDQYADLMQEPFGLPNRPTKHHIELLPGAVPPKGRIYRRSPGELEELRKQLETLTNKGWIRPNTSEFGAPILFVPKGNGKFRMCIDYRDLNKITRKSTEPLPRIDDLLDMVQGYTVFSKVDLKSGHHKIEMAEEDVYKTAFKTKYETYEFLIMPFGLCNAPGTFQTEMHRIFRPYLDKFMVVYLDDILVFSKTAREHAEHLALVLQSLRDSQYKINREKSSFGVPSVIYLVLQQDDGNGLRPVESMGKKIKTQKLQDSTYEKELYALVCALKHWKHFLLGRHFKIFSDHSTLQWMKSQGELNDKLERYIQFIDMFDFELKHKKGCYNKVADALSRRPDSFALISSTHSFGEETRQTIARLLPQDESFGPIVRNLQADPNSEPGYALSSDLLYTCSRVLHGVAILVGQLVQLLNLGLQRVQLLADGGWCSEGADDAEHCDYVVNSFFQLACRGCTAGLTSIWSWCRLLQVLYTGMKCPCSILVQILVVLHCLSENRQLGLQVVTDPGPPCGVPWYLLRLRLEAAAFQLLPPLQLVGGQPRLPAGAVPQPRLVLTELRNAVEFGSYKPTSRVHEQFCVQQRRWCKHLRLCKAENQLQRCSRTRWETAP
ncbi:hypothetical protein CBR_g50058 [Chara braunii]|uniref:Reverse transcriptase domain-containing protein n=1 Tax=Chara braunii TaxID=69332 RepID=A0A388M5W0_CHABU|nr:hypothetical protein CBR_g50058 [Chara braunii]|eukprot:GBG89968.1 hypothetical protein CBR_g50058 [Chara braunii]